MKKKTEKARGGKNQQEEPAVTEKTGRATAAAPKAAHTTAVEPMKSIHRFVLVLFQQLGRQTVYAPGWRQNFNTRDFAELYNLGPPVAAVYFNCQREAGSGGRRMYN
jgi:hypothetical protein